MSVLLMTPPPNGPEMPLSSSFEEEYERCEVCGEPIEGHWRKRPCLKSEGLKP